MYQDTVAISFPALTIAFAGDVEILEYHVFRLRLRTVAVNLCLWASDKARQSYRLPCIKLQVGQ
jgi:hypothetical protein